jgi:hypothetical protein
MHTTKQEYKNLLHMTKRPETPARREEEQSEDYAAIHVG